LRKYLNFLLCIRIIFLVWSYLWSKYICASYFVATKNKFVYTSVFTKGRKDRDPIRPRYPMSTIFMGGRIHTVMYTCDLIYETTPRTHWIRVYAGLHTAIGSFRYGILLICPIRIYPLLFNLTIVYTFK